MCIGGARAVRALPRGDVRAGALPCARRARRTRIRSAFNPEP